MFLKDLFGLYYQSVLLCQCGCGCGCGCVWVWLCVWYAHVGSAYMFVDTSWGHMHCGHMWGYMCVHMYIEASNWHQFLFFSLYILRYRLSLNLEVTSSASPASQLVRATCFAAWVLGSKLFEQASYTWAFCPACCDAFFFFKQALHITAFLYSFLMQKGKMIK